MEYTEKEFTPNKIYDYIKKCGLNVLGQELIKGNEHIDKHEFIDRLEREINYTKIKYDSEIYNSYNAFQLKIMLNVFQYESFHTEEMIRNYFKAIAYEYIKEMRIKDKSPLHSINSTIFIERLDESKYNMYERKNMDKQVKIRYEIK